MARLADVVYTLTIPNGETVSNEVVIGGWLRGCSVFAPGTLPEAVSVQIAALETGTEWRVLQSGGTDVTVPANRAIMITEGTFKRIRLESAVNVGADRTFMMRVMIGGY